MPKLTVVDVGHGNAAVLEDSTGTVIVDTGRGTSLLDFLEKRRLTKVEALLLSHADTDHMGGASTLIASPDFQVGQVFANPDGSKGSRAWKGFIAALALASAEGRIRATVGLHVGTAIRAAGAETPVVVLYPPPAALLGGTASKIAPATTSNNLSVAVHVRLAGARGVILGGDVEMECLDYWKKEKVPVEADAAVFPHHGGAPGDAGKAGLFAFEFTRLVQPQAVIFSIHESMYSLPRTDVVAGILKAKAGIHLLCTRLPAHIRKAVLAGVKEWTWHLDTAAKPPACRCGHITIEYEAAGVTFTCVPD